MCGTSDLVLQEYPVTFREAVGGGSWQKVDLIFETPRQEIRACKLITFFSPFRFQMYFLTYLPKIF